MLHNNSRFLNLFKEKAELFNTSSEQYDTKYYSIPKEQIPIIPPTLSEEFARFEKK